MSKKFKIEAVGYGGEFAMCTKDSDFVEQWEDEDEMDLIEAVEDTWYDDADLEHVHGMYADSNFTVYEIKGEEEIEIDDEVEVHSFMSREAYTTDSSDIGPTPVLVFHGAEKGTFGSWELEAEEFEPQKLTASIVETDFGEIIQDVYYNGKKLEYNGDYIDTVGKGYHAKVAWLNPEWHEKKSTFDNEELVKESWECHLENYG